MFCEGRNSDYSLFEVKIPIAHRRAGPAVLLGRTRDLSLLSGLKVDSHESRNTGQLPLPLPLMSPTVIGREGPSPSLGKTVELSLAI